VANPAFVQGGTGSGSSSPLTINLTGVSAGDVICLAIRWTNGGNPISSIGDNENSGNWTTATTQINAAFGGLQCFVGVMNSVGAGGDVTITVQWGSAPSTITYLWEEVSGVAGVQASGGTSSASGISTTADSGTATTSANNTWAFGIGVCSTGVAAATGTLSEREQVGSPVRNIISDALISTSGTGVDATYSVSGSWGAQVVLLAPAAASKSWNADAYIQNLATKNWNADTYIFGTEFFFSHAWNADAYISPLAIGFIQLEVDLIPSIIPGNFIKLASDLIAQSRGFVQLATTLQSKVLGFVQLNTSLQEKVRSYVKLSTDLQKGGYPSWNADCYISLGNNLSFVQMAVDLAANVIATGCDGSYPDINFVKLEAWLIEAGSGPGSSHQAPGISLLTTTDDWNASSDAALAYPVIARFVLAGINLIVTGFTAGVMSYQTRTRQWLRLVDYLPGGVVVSEQTSTRTLPNGQVITTVVTTTLVQDVTTTATVVTYGGTGRVSTSIVSVDKNGTEVKRQIETNTTNGVQHTVENKIVTSQPPTTENVQPIKVVTLDGVNHYQFFGTPNPNWAGGDQEGTTTTESTSQIVPASLNGETVDSLGNPILAKVTNSNVATPDGKVINTNTTEIGTMAAGTTYTDTASQFNGIQTTTVVTTNYPDGSQSIVTTVTDILTGDSVQTTVENDTDENGLVTTITTVVETKTASTANGNQTTVTTTKTTQGPSGTTTDTTVATRNNFEDALLSAKIKVYTIQEFTINCVIDQFNMKALLEHQIDHQKNFAIVELIGQQLGNMDLSWSLRNDLIDQFNTAMNCIVPLQLQALGSTHNVIFAPSAAAFRAKYIPGTMPPVYELQMILQERSDTVTGLVGF